MAADHIVDHSGLRTEIWMTPGTFTNGWTCPNGVDSIVVECYGAGGGDVAGGGGYGKKTISVTPGNTYTLGVGLGGTGTNNGGSSYFIDTSTVAGLGGQHSGAGSNGGSYVGDSGYSGGNGGAGGGTAGGGYGGQGGGLFGGGGGAGNGTNGASGGGGGAGSSYPANPGAGGGAYLGYGGSAGYGTYYGGSFGGGGGGGTGTHKGGDGAVYITYTPTGMITVNSATSGDGAASSNTIQIPATSLTSGNLITIGVRYNSATATCSISDTAGNTYTQIGTYLLNGTDRISMWYAKNTAGNANNVVTVTISTACTYRYASSIQFSGLDIENPLDTSATGTVTSGTTITSGNFTTTTANQIIVSLAQVASVTGTWTAGSGYTKQIDSYQNVTSMQYKIVSSIQTGVNTSMTNTDSSNLKSIFVATFKEYITSGNSKVLVVAGGGGGGFYGGGGGAGGVIYNSDFTITPQTYTVTIGSGGNGDTTVSGTGSNGGNSIFGTLTAIGGGGGGSRQASPFPGTDGAAGGSGGGGSPSDSASILTYGGTATSGQGYAGGNGRTPAASGNWGGAGGGGANAVGANATGNNTTSSGGAGGVGIVCDITGTSTYYGGGGGGGLYTGATSGSAGAGGNGGGGAGGKGIVGVNGTSNTGGGGGGGGHSSTEPLSGGNGGSGIVIVRWTTTDFGTCSVTGTGNTITTSGADSIATMIVSGNLTITEGTPVASANFLLMF